jgi:hypothetical protein
LAVALWIAVLFLAQRQLCAQVNEGMALGLEGSGLTAVEGSPEASSESTIVEIPLPITLRAPRDGKIGLRLRFSVFFSWNDVRFEDIGGEDIAASLRTLTVVPGFELMIPVGERWMVRPYGQVGGLSALDVTGYRWMASVGARASYFWKLDRWLLSAGGRLDYTSVFDEGLRRSDEVAFIDLGGDFSFPLWFDVKGERAAAGFFLIPRFYFNPATFIGQDGFDLGVDSHLEVGVSFQIADQPKLWFVKLPKWYGVGVRLAQNHRSLRIYLGFPF